MKENKNLLLLVIAIATLLVAIIGATFAFFAANMGAGSSTPITVTTASVATLTYTGGSPISFTVTQQNFYKDAGNLSGNTTTNVTLNAGNSEASTYCYTVDVNISTNGFNYTTVDNQPELQLTIAKSLDNSTYTDILENYDITNKTGIINVPTVKDGTVYKNTITAATSATTNNYIKATVQMVNLGVDQSANSGKSFSAKLDLTTVSCD